MLGLARIVFVSLLLVSCKGDKSSEKERPFVEPAGYCHGFSYENAENVVTVNEHCAKTVKACNEARVADALSTKECLPYPALWCYSILDRPICYSSEHQCISDVDEFAKIVLESAMTPSCKRFETYPE